MKIKNSIDRFSNMLYLKREQRTGRKVRRKYPEGNVYKMQQWKNQEGDETKRIW